jgi:hypothetical protein
MSHLDTGSMVAVLNGHIKFLWGRDNVVPLLFMGIFVFIANRNFS